MTAPERIFSLLHGSGATLSCAESCTGGNIARVLTSVPGSSEYFLGGIVSYSPSVKESALGVSQKLISERGVVSSEVAAAMAEGVRRLTGSDYSVSTTGLAGPGGDGVLPEGTVWIGISGRGETRTFLYKTGSPETGLDDVSRRISNISDFTEKALALLADFISH